MRWRSGLSEEWEKKFGRETKVLWITPFSFDSGNMCRNLSPICSLPCWPKLINICMYSIICFLFFVFVFSLVLPCKDY